MKNLLLCAALAAVAAAPVRAADPAAPAHDAAPAHAGAAAHWEYDGHAGPGHWGDLEPDYATCKLGKTQSPIDIRDAAKGELPILAFNYTAGAAEVVNNGHTIQVNLGAGGKAKLTTGTFKLVQFHFHTPSEEMVDGKAYPMVAHLVHRNDDGKLAVVAVLFTVGKENAVLARVFAAMPRKVGDKAELPGGVNPADLLPAKQGYYAYMGSLTTPPCSEDVRWQVMKEPVELSSAQLATFRKLYPMNARPVQPLNGRRLQQS